MRIARIACIACIARIGRNARFARKLSNVRIAHRTMARARSRV